MEDQLISFETAKLAKEKGFNWKVLQYYYLSRSNQTTPVLQNLGKAPNEYRQDCFIGIYTDFNNAFADDELWYSAPTQNFLQKWLREVKRIHVFNVICGTKGKDLKIAYCYCILQDTRITEFCGLKVRQNSKKYYTYEEALEQGLTEALKLIK